MPAVLAHRDDARFLEHVQVFGHLRLGLAEFAHEIVDRALPRDEGVQDFPPSTRIAPLGCPGARYR
ncbi:hypothetical protein HUW46_08566 [Amycolatopsis sp. CA-230715]|nr:hypothetical protein HUW46_08566 [Amycolatopsis sp. CA-230715]